MITALERAADQLKTTQKERTVDYEISNEISEATLESHYQTLVRYLNLQDQGMVLGRGCGSPSMTKHSRYPKMAYELGKRL